MTDPASHFGVLRVGDFRFALSASVLREVIPQSVLTPLPDPGPLALGTFRRQVSIVPAFDLMPLLSGVPGPPQTRRFLAIVHHNGLLLALAVDELAKVVRLAPAGFSNFENSAGGSHRLFPRHFWDSEADCSIGVLDPEALLHVPSICGARDQSETTSTQIAASAPTLHLALFTIGQRTFGVDTHSVREALHPGKIEPANLPESVLFGHSRSGDRLTPIIHLHEFLALPYLGEQRLPERGLVIEQNCSTSKQTASLGFLIDNVVGAVQVPAADLHPLAASGLPHSRYYRGVLRTATLGYVLVLDAAALLEDDGTAELAHHNATAVDESAPSAAARAACDAPVSLVVYRAAGGTLASPLNDLEAVVPLTQVFGLGRPGEAFLGVMHWRQRPVNLLDASVLLGAPADTGTDVLIVKCSEALYGFRVSKVDSLASACLEPAPELSRPQLSGLLHGHGAQLAASMIQVRSGSQRRNVTVLDLKGAAAVIAG